MLGFCLPEIHSLYDSVGQSLEFFLENVFLVLIMIFERILIKNKNQNKTSLYRCFHRENLIIFRHRKIEFQFNCLPTNIHSFNFSEHPITPSRKFYTKCQQSNFALSCENNTDRASSTAHRKKSLLLVENLIEKFGNN